MAQWIPSGDQPVGPHEQIGRRLFDEPLLVGTQDQAPFPGLDLRHFEEKRDGKVSLDRLGRTGIEKAVVRYLCPRAIADGKKFRSPREFQGWAVLKALAFSNSGKVASEIKATVVASPLAGAELDANVYHAHVDTPSGVSYYVMALHLRHLFTSFGSIERANSCQTAEGVSSVPLFNALRAFFLRALARINRFRKVGGN